MGDRWDQQTVMPIEWRSNDFVSELAARSLLLFKNSRFSSEWFKKCLIRDSNLVIFELDSNQEKWFFCLLVFANVLERDFFNPEIGLRMWFDHVCSISALLTNRDSWMQLQLMILVDIMWTWHWNKHDKKQTSFQFVVSVLFSTIEVTIMMFQSIVRTQMMNSGRMANRASTISLSKNRMSCFRVRYDRNVRDSIDEI